MAVIKNAKTRDIIIDTGDEMGVKETVKEAFNRGMLLVDADLRGADLSGFDYSGCDFTGAIMSCANLSNCNLDGCNFNMAILSAANLSGASLCNAKMLGARVVHASFPTHSAMITAGTGLPFFTCGMTVEIAGQLPMPVTTLMDMTEQDAMEIGGTALRDALPKLKNAVSYFAK